MLSLETQSLNSSGYKRVESHGDRWRTMWKSREITGCPHTRAQTRLPPGDFKVLSLEYMHEAILNHSWSAKPLAIEMEFVLELVFCKCRLNHVGFQSCCSDMAAEQISCEFCRQMAAHTGNVLEGASNSTSSNHNLGKKLHAWCAISVSTFQLLVVQLPVVGCVQPPAL